ncbi:HAMP domain-containing sensor histidine kinase [Nocardioides marinquilinus]|uniref:histidine kinase n=1 Tax=Nocardioides marinquilinus TaxID=1210400 RepID=A0ABP9PUE8_9ACTN
MATTTEHRTPDARPPRPGVSVRVRITAAVALLVAATLAGAGALVYVIEVQRLDDQTAGEVEQEIGEFEALAASEGRSEPDLAELFRTFMLRNVPDDDELLVGWVGDGPVFYSPDDDLVNDETFKDQVRPLVDDGGTARFATADGELLVSAQPVRRGRQTGALVVVNYLDEDRAELRDTMRTYAIVGLLSLLVIVGAAFSLAGRLLRPLRAVRETADEITETDLSRRLPLSGNDDVTALTRTFNGMLDRLEAAFAGQRQLLDDAGHELRTPLTVLQGHLELLDADDPAEVAETRELLLDEVDRMARLVDDLILLAKTERPDFLDVAGVEVTALVESVAAKAAGLGDRAWTVDETVDVVVPADAQRLTQALLQLAHNAVKHTGPGDAVAFGAACVDGLVLLWVRDTGPGVAPADRERIFERFGRGVAPDADGFGLGLSIVTAIAQAHGGDAWLDADYLDGARFVVSVPLPEGHPGPRSSADDERTPGPPGPHAPPSAVDPEPTLPLAVRQEV